MQRLRRQALRMAEQCPELFLQAKEVAAGARKAAADDCRMPRITVSAELQQSSCNRAARGLQQTEDDWLMFRIAMSTDFKSTSVGVRKEMLETLRCMLTSCRILRCKLNLYA
jgi:hypothetical protein